MANHSFQPNARVQVTNSPEACQGLAAIEDVCEPPAPAPSRFELVAGDDGIRFVKFINDLWVFCCINALFMLWFLHNEPLYAIQQKR